MPTVESIKKKLYTENQYGYKYQDPSARLDKEDVDWLVEKYSINPDVHRTCINCQARQVFKYETTKDKKTGKYIKDFRVPCQFIPRTLPPGSATALQQMVFENGMDKERAKLLLKSTIDAVAWGELMFGFKDTDPRWRIRNYQKEQLRCSSPRVVIREGRRSGKTFAMALRLLHRAFNQEVNHGLNNKGEAQISGPTIMIVTPYQSQILNIFDEMEKILKRNTDLVKEVTTGSGGTLYVKTPFFRMEMSNGAVIKGFVSGVGTKVDGSGGGTMRGQNADVVYLDEMDMIPEEVLDKVIIPILLTNDNVSLLATSTPIGKRGRFFNWCLEDATFKEDYLPSTVLPQWAKMADMIESENSTEAFAAEYMAQFIEGSHGVFKPSLVYAGRRGYKYSDTTDKKWWRQFAFVNQPDSLIKVIGIDWNKNAGTEFVVVAYDPNSHRYFVCETVNITASDFSSIRWKEEVVRLNYKWKPDYIYADEGYGHTIIEDLKVLAFNIQRKQAKNLRDVETAKLIERLVAFNFSQRIDLKSPIDGTDIVKSGKEFLVENAVRVFEDEIIWYSEEDEALRKQLLNYVVLRRSQQTQKPVYGPENEAVGDHRLDALMLALAAYQLEMGMYTLRGLPTSKPQFLSREKLAQRAMANGDNATPGGELLRFIEKQHMTAPGALKVLQIMRQGETIEEAKERGETSKHGLPARTRSRVAEKQQSVLEYYKENASDYRGYSNDTEHVYQKERGPEAPHVIERRRKARHRMFKKVQKLGR